MTMRKVRPTNAAMSRQSSRKWETEYEQTNSWLTLYINSGKYWAPILRATCSVLKKISAVVSAMITSSTSMYKNRCIGLLFQNAQINRCIGLSITSIPSFPLLSLPSWFSPVRWWRLGSVWSFSFAVVSAWLIPIVWPTALCLPGAISLISILLCVRSSGAFVLQCVRIDSDQERRMPVCISCPQAQVIHCQLSRSFRDAVYVIVWHAKFICKKRWSFDLKFLLIVE